jgi:hypothetical protein
VFYFCCCKERRKMSTNFNSNLPLTSGVRTASLSEIWDELKQGIESVYSQQTMTKATYMRLYSQVYNHCTSSSARSTSATGSPAASSPQNNINNNRNAQSIVPSTSKSKKSQGTNPSEGAQIIGCELYHKLQRFLESYLEELQKVC